ncbi:unnamed protein product [Merluccius merluccius]
MSIYHDEVEIEDFEYEEETETYYFPCPCGDRFVITKEDLENGEEVATCPSCSLIVKVIYDQEEFMSGEVVELASTENKLALAQS